MKIDITPILRNSGAALDFVFDETLGMLEGGIGTVTFTGPVHLEGKVRNFNGMLELEAKAAVSYTTQCDRCCDPLSGTLSVDIREDIVESGTEAAPDGAETQEEEERYVFTGHVLELDVIAAESLLLDTPPYNLCKDDCLGLCPDCGANLNRNACNCGSNRPVDFRLEVLKRFSDPDDT